MRGTHVRFVLPALVLAAMLAVPAFASAAPRLEGTFKTIGTVKRASGSFNEDVGSKVQRTWRFAPRCPSGACAKTLLKRTSNRPGVIEKELLTKIRPQLYRSNESESFRDRGGCRVRLQYRMTVRV